MNPIVYKITPKDTWQSAKAAGAFEGAPIDLIDGYIHFSTADQARETAAKHFAGQDELLLVAIDAAALGDALKWEPSRGGALFPHLYAHLAMEHVLWEKPMPLNENGVHQMPLEDE